MKKFVIVMISFLVLFIFLILNYLLWDKENLQRQSANDKIEQDWLRGQNRTLQAIIDEQELSIKALKKDKEVNLSRIVELEQQLRMAGFQQETSARQAEMLKEAINEYKLFVGDILKALTLEWFKSINENRYDDSHSYIADNIQFFDKYLNKQTYAEYILSIENISFIDQTEQEAGPDFRIMKGEGDTLDVVAEALIELHTAEQKETGFDLHDGTYLLKVTYRYLPDETKWVIVSIMEIESTNP